MYCAAYPALTDTTAVTIICQRKGGDGSREANKFTEYHDVGDAITYGRNHKRESRQ